MYFNHLDVLVEELALHTDFHQPVGTVVMAMLTSLLAEYWTIIEHIKLGRINKQLNMASIHLLLVQHEVEIHKSKGGQCCDQVLATTSNPSQDQLTNHKQCQGKLRPKGNSD